ncbi:hypothetical protein ABZY31_19910, partial [Streptomyces sp. NPDC006529]|uniref:hypothetical protein n=1 Tax=Streptomyces sp. NPDC006529 TaxID=3157177 RepID=UPI00339FF48B
VYSNGVVLLALAAIALIVAFDAELTRLIQLYTTPTWSAGRGSWAAGRRGTPGGPSIAGRA